MAAPHEEMSMNIRLKFDLGETMDMLQDSDRTGSGSHVAEATLALYSLGESPVHCLKARAKLFSLRKPTAAATCLTGRAVRHRSSTERSRLASSFNSCKEAPSSCS